MPIIREEELLKTKLQLVRGKKFHIGGTCVELDLDVEGFLDFCVQHGIDTVFYKYAYYDKQDYLITEDLLQENTENPEELAFCKEWANTYNAETDTLDFTEPYELALGATYGAMNIVLVVKNEWLVREKALEALLAYQEDNEDELLEMSDYDEGTTIVDELREVLLADKVFRFCTNKEARSEYMKKFLAKKENKKYLILGKGAKHEWDRAYQINQVVNQIYNEYRNECYQKKIPVGEQLPDEA